MNMEILGILQPSQYSLVNHATSQESTSHEVIAILEEG